MTDKICTNAGSAGDKVAQEFLGAATSTKAILGVGALSGIMAAVTGGLAPVVLAVVYVATSGVIKHYVLGS